MQCISWHELCPNPQFIAGAATGTDICQGALDSFLLALSFPVNTFAVCSATSACSSQGKGSTTLQSKVDVL
uniref:Uncharacterized protein n=1 Tax=Taeniopygia guttata TaxID=59729 RepID=A0A674GHU2_TAEGU